MHISSTISRTYLLGQPAHEGAPLAGGKKRGGGGEGGEEGGHTHYHLHITFYVRIGQYHFCPLEMANFDDGGNAHILVFEDIGIRIAEIDQLLCVRLETDFEH